MTPYENARRMLAEGLIEPAEAICAALLAAQQRDPEALHIMGLIRFQQHRLDEAAFLLGASSALDERSTTLSDLAVVQLAHGDSRAAIAGLERALFVDPGNAAGWCLLGYAYESLEDAPMAVRCFLRATQIDPGNADAHAHLAALRSADGRPTDAAAGYRAALKADPRQPEVWNNLGVLLEGEEALKAFGEAIALRPGYADAHYNRGNALRALGRPLEALAAYERALELEPGREDAEHNLAGALMEANRPLDAAEIYGRRDGPEARFSRALALLSTGDFARGLELYEARLSMPSVAIARHEGLPRWQGESLQGRRILVYDEQGLGDTLQFLRYARLLREAGAQVVVEVNPIVLELARTMIGVDEVIQLNSKPPPCDFQCPLMSLPRAFGTTLETIPGGCPYLWPPQSRLDSWSRRLPEAGGRMRVGLAWSGNANFGNDRQRSMPVRALDPVLSRRDCMFHVLQTEVRPDDQARLLAHPQVHNAGREIVDASDAAAVASMMDVVISVDTSVAHLAGALAVPVWVLLPHAPDWRWLMDREDSPWYPSARLFRQRAQGDWADVVRRVGEALDGLV